MVHVGPFARPWRDVEQSAPAVLYRQPHVKCFTYGPSSERSLNIHLGRDRWKHAMKVALTQTECSYSVSDAAEPAAKLPLSRLHGARVRLLASKADRDSGQYH